MLVNWEQSLSFDESDVQVIREETRLKALSSTLAFLPTESQAFILKHNIRPTHGKSPNLKFTRAPMQSRVLISLLTQEKRLQSRKGIARTFFGVTFAKNIAIPDKHVGN